MAKTDSFTGAVEKAIAKGQLSPAERKAAERLKQLSPAERKIQADLDRKRASAKSTKPTNTGLKTTTNTGLKTTTNTSIKTVPDAAPKSGGMRTVTGRATTVADDVAKIGGKAASVGKGAAVLKGAGKVVGKIAVPLAAIEQAYQTGRLIGSEEARDEATQEYEDMADDNALMRAGKGALGGVTTIYGMASNIGALGESLDEGKASQRAYEEKAKDPKVQRALQSAKAIQTAYMKLPADERAKVDAMGGAKAKQYLVDKLAADSFVGPPAPAKRPTAAPASSEPARPSSPATAGAQQGPMERRVTATDAFSRLAAPKAIVVDEPVDEDRAMALFQNTHGGPFDPKSSMDKGKMAAILKLMSQKGSEKLTPNQFSLQIYRQS